MSQFQGEAGFLEGGPHLHGAEGGIVEQAGIEAEETGAGPVRRGIHRVVEGFFHLEGEEAPEIAEFLLEGDVAAQLGDELDAVAHAAEGVADEGEILDRRGLHDLNIRDVVEVEDHEAGAFHREVGAQAVADGAAEPGQGLFHPARQLRIGDAADGVDQAAQVRALDEAGADTFDDVGDIPRGDDVRRLDAAADCDGILDRGIAQFAGIGEGVVGKVFHGNTSVVE